MSGFSMDDYVDVAERIVKFAEKYPEGSLQQHRPPDLMNVGDRVFIVYTAAAYRTPDDPRPGIGTAWEPYPGKTPYTRDSELMNAETAAWGRAIVATGVVASRKLASKQEVKARQADRDATDPSAAPADATAARKPVPSKGPKATEAQLRKVFATAKDNGVELDMLKAIVTRYTDDGSTKSLALHDVDNVLRDIHQAAEDAAGAREHAASQAQEQAA